MRIKNTFRTSYFASYKIYVKARETSNYAQIMPIMPLCKYVYEYVMPEDNSFIMKLVLDTAFWHTRSLLQKVTLESSRWHHSLYYQIWQFHENMRIAHEVIPSIDGRHLGTIWYIPMTRKGLCPIDNLKNLDHYVKNRENLLPMEIILITHGTCSIISQIAPAYLSHNCPMGSAQK